MNANRRPRSFPRRFLPLVCCVLMTAVLLTINWNAGAAAHTAAYRSHADGLNPGFLNGGPTIASLIVNPVEIDEGSSFILSGQLSNTGPDSILSIAIDWGDGHSMTKKFSRGCASFSFNHFAADDHPSGTGADNITINATLSGEQGTLSTAAAVIKINNLPPTVDLGPGMIRYVAEEISFLAKINDPGSLDTHTISWDFGDGSPPQAGSTTTYSFDQPGTYFVTATVEDDDGGIGQATIQVEILAVRYLPLIIAP